MATKTPTQLTIADVGNVDDTVVFVIDDKLGSTRKLTMAQLRTQVLAPIGTTLTLTGDVTGSGANNGSIALTIPADTISTSKIANSAVTFAKMVSVAANVLLGRTTAGTGVIETITIGSGLTLTGGVLTASTPASAAPSATLLTHRAFGGF